LPCGELALTLATAFATLAADYGEMMSLVVSISGIRGIVGKSLTPEVVVKYAGAFGEYCGRGSIVLGRDGRASGQILADIASSALLAMGCDVLAIGVSPTPTVALAVQESAASGGIAITASHNPVEWNGMKFIGSHGMFLAMSENRRFWEIAERRNRAYAGWDSAGALKADDSHIEMHIRKVLALPLLDVSAIRRRKFKVVVDCINAAGGVIVPQLLRRLGCSLIEMNCDVSGVFARAPEPIPENLSAVCKRVRAERADLGIVVDPDVDRLVLITEKGEPLGEEYTVTSIVNFVLKKTSTRKKGGHARAPIVVVNLSTTRAVEDVARRYGAKVLRTPVGEINVAKKMKEVGAVVGGEGSGGVILPSLHYCRDAVLGIGLVMQMLTESKGKLSELKKTLPHYEIVKAKVEIGNADPSLILGRIERDIGSSSSVNREDGLRVDLGDSWVHLRKSNTEPIIRIIAEASSRDKAEEIIEHFRKRLGTLT